MEEHLNSLVGKKVDFLLSKRKRPITATIVSVTADVVKVKDIYAYISQAREWKKGGIERKFILGVFESEV